MLQRYRCPNCFVPVNYGQQYCGSCGVAINWQGISSSAPFGAKDISTVAGRPADWQNLPGAGSGEQWKQELQEKSRLWHKKLYYDPDYGQSSHDYHRKSSSHTGLIVLLVVLVLLLVVFGVVGIATGGTYFNIFSPYPGTGTTSNSMSLQTSPPSSPVDSRGATSSDIDSPASVTSVDTQKLIASDGVSVSTKIPVINIAELEQQIYNLINAERNKYGMQALAWDEKLNTVSRRHSGDMALRNYFNHVSPEGYTVKDRYQQGGYAMTVGCGENIFLCPVAKVDYYRNGMLVKTEYYNQSEIAGVVVRGWMDSAGHRENILNSIWKVQAIGVAVSSDNKVYITENFA